MYRVVMLSLLGIIVLAFGASAFSLLHTPLNAMMMSFFVIGLTAIVTHYLCMYAYKAPANIESSIITASILFLIIAPSTVLYDLFWAGFITLVAILSKYVLAYRYRHIWNPVAFTLVFASLLGFGGGVWWVATPALLVPVIVGGLLVVQKIRRFDLVLSYLITAALLHMGLSLYRGAPFVDTLQGTLVSWPVLFFAFFMLTEPLSTPPQRRERIIYGVIVGVLSNVTFHFGPFFSSPELSLVIGNIFSYFVSAHSRAILVLREKIELAKDTFEFVFDKPADFTYVSGQYMEWTIPHSPADSRGVRRYFTISSAPEDTTLRLGVKMYPNGSTLKQTLSSLSSGSVIYGMHPVGDFVLPANQETPVVFVAGGIGITPFMSMIRSHVAHKSLRKIILFYANKTHEEIAYLEELTNSGIQVVHILGSGESAPVDFVYERGFINAEMISKYVADIASCECYISGPHGMVVNYTKLFADARAKKVHTDFFPGFV